MNFWQKYTERFVPESMKSSPFTYRKGVILVWLFLCLILLCVIQAFFAYVLDLDSFNYFFFLGACYIASLWAFKKTQSIKIAANLCSLISYFFLVSWIPSTGGAFSDNLFWMLGIPMLSILFVNNLNGSIWFLIVFVTQLAIYFYGKSHPGFNKPILDENYFVMSAMTLTLFATLAVLVLERSQIYIVELLRNKNELLAEQKMEIERHIEALEKTKKKLLETNEELQNFAYAASHDLKEPLRMIGMYSQLIQKRLSNHLDDNTKEYAFYVNDGVVRMKKLLDDLLLYSRLGKNANDTEAVDLNNTLLSVVYNLTVVIKETQASILSSNLPEVPASSTEMAQLFQNLVANAIKFRKPDEEPRVEIRHAQLDNEHLFSVCDNGIGIRKEFHQSVFGLFTRLHSREKYDGSGIGLATCHKIVKNMGGRMWVDSTEGVGTTFFFTIPNPTTHAPSTNRPQEAAAA